MKLSDDVMRAIGHYEAAVIDYVETEEDAAVVDSDAVLEGVEANGITLVELDEDVHEAIVNEVHRSLKVRGESAESIDFIAEGADYRDENGEWQTARRELAIPKGWNEG